MKRQLIIGLVLVLLIGVCFGTYFGIDHYQTQKEKKAAEEAAALQLSSFTSDDVTKLVLHTPELDYTIDKDDDSKWQVAEGSTLHINTYYIDALCTYGCGVTATKDLGAAGEKQLETYGLSDPVSIAYYTDDADKPVKTLYVGKQNPTNTSFYMMQDDDDHVYLVDSDTAGYLYVTKTQLRYRYLLDDLSSSFTALTLKRGDETVYTFQDMDGNSDWQLTEPLSTPIGADNSKLSNLFNNITELEADDFGDSDVTADKYASYGFDKPAYTFQLTQANGDTTTLLVKEFDPSVSSYVDCLRVESNEILKMDSNYLSFLEDNASDYMLSTVYKVNLTDISAFTVQYHGSFNDTTLDIDRSFTADSDSETYSCDGKQITSADTELLESFQTFYTALSNLSYESLDTAADVPTDTDPALHLTYTMKDGSTHTMDLVKKDDTTYWAFIDGTFTHAVVRQRALSGEDKVLVAYTAMEKLLDAAAA